MKRSKQSAFTLVELLVVIGIIGLLLAVLLPALSKAREQATTVKCISNLRQLGLAFTMYANEHKGFLPYPTTTLGEPMLWWNCVDPYLKATADSRNYNSSSVASGRTYKSYKQCPVWDTFDGNDGHQGGNQDLTKEFARTYKINSHLRHPNSTPAKINEVKNSSQFVLMGDGISLDIVGYVTASATAGQFDNGQFSMEVNTITAGSATWPALRHRGAANILFVDGHVATTSLPTRTLVTANPPSKTVRTWQGEWLDSGGIQVDPPNHTRSAESQNLTRNPKMPLIWSIPGKLYRP